MWKHLFIALLIFFHSSTLWAEEPLPQPPQELEYKKNAIGYRVAETAVGGFTDFLIFSISYQRFFNRWVGLEISPAFAYVTADTIDSYWAGGLSIGPRINFEGKGVQGWWIEPLFEFFYGSGSSLEIIDFDGGWLGGTLSVGYSWLLRNGFYADVGLGISVRIFEGRLTDFDFNDVIAGVHPYFQFVLGYGW